MGETVNLDAKQKNRFQTDHGPKCETIKFPEGNIEKYLHDVGVGKDLLNKIQRVLAIRQKMNKLNYKKT